MYTQGIAPDLYAVTACDLLGLVHQRPAQSEAIDVEVAYGTAHVTHGDRTIRLNRQLHFNALSIRPHEGGSHHAFFSAPDDLEFVIECGEIPGNFLRTFDLRHG